MAKRKKVHPRKKAKRSYYLLLTLILLALVIVAVVWSANIGSDPAAKKGNNPASKSAKNSAPGSDKNSAQKDKKNSTSKKESNTPSKSGKGSVSPPGTGSASSHPLTNELSVINLSEVPVHGHIECPAHTPNDSLIYNRQGRHTLQYSPHNRVAIWVAYKLTQSDLEGGAGRSSSFRVDELLQRRGFPVARSDDYKASGYDKGHLLPSADRQATIEQNRSTFLLSNCAPQLPQLNRGPWKSLEEQVRLMCRSFDTVYVVTGAILKSPKGRIGRGGVVIPSHFFKVLLFRKADLFYQSQAFMMPNEDDLAPQTQRYHIAMDSLERATGLQFFPSIRY